MTEPTRRVNTAKQKRPVRQEIVTSVIFESQNKSRGVTKNLFIISSSLIVLLGISLTTNVLLFNIQPKDRYFAVDNHLRVIPLVSTNIPMLNSESLINWATASVLSINKLTYTSWRNDLQNNSRLFESKAFDDFVNQISNNGNLNLIRDKRLNTIVNIDGAVVVTEHGVHPATGVYTWIVEAPIVINYESSNGVEATQRVVARMTINRVSTLEEPTGIKIKNYIAMRRDGR